MGENKAGSRKGKKRIIFNEKLLKTTITEPIRVLWRGSSDGMMPISRLFIVGDSPNRFRIPVPIQIRVRMQSKTPLRLCTDGINTQKK
jgi:hypothetical protein